MFRYSTYCIENGNPIDDPYDEDDDVEISIMVCETMAIATKCRWFVFDNVKGRDIYVYRGDKI